MLNGWVDPDRVQTMIDLIQIYDTLILVEIGAECMKYVLFYSVIVIAFAISSCNRATLEYSIGTTRNEWLTNWLDHPTCQPPCWESIRPGKTSIADALVLLKQLPNLKITSSNDSSIGWLQDGTDTGWISGSNNTVSSIALQINRGEILLLSEINDIYGPPSNVRLFRCLEGMCEVDLTYPGYGMILGLYLPNIGITSNEVSITSKTRVDSITLFQDLETFIESPSDTGATFIDWQGYSKYP
jgi:hypothetical protein